MLNKIKLAFLEALEFIIYGGSFMGILSGILFLIFLSIVKIHSYMGDYIITVDPLENGKETVIYKAHHYISHEAGLIDIKLLDGSTITINGSTCDIQIEDVPEGSLIE